MGRGIDSYIKEQFGIAEVDIRTYSPLTLAYIGDGIYDLVIRSVVVGKGNTRAGELHKRTSQIVKAHTQAEMMEVLLLRSCAPVRPDIRPAQKACRLSCRNETPQAPHCVPLFLIPRIPCILLFFLLPAGAFCCLQHPLPPADALCFRPLIPLPAADVL